MAGTAEQTEVRGGPIVTPIQNSLFEGPIQVSLLGSITDRAVEALRETNLRTFYVAFSRPNYPDAINGPFDFGVDRKELQPKDIPTDVYGPFDRKTGCSFAYIRQEGRAFICATSSPELSKLMRKLRVSSAKAFGEGIIRFSDRLDLIRRMHPTLTPEKILEVAMEQAKALETEYRRQKKTPSKTGESAAQIREAQDRIKGFRHGALLAGELLKQPWGRLS